ncbi:MAG: hypothetical protein ACRDD1_17900 [Planctomycetia bacterium]
MRDGQAVQQAATDALEWDFGITHATVQIEVDGCGTTEVHCELRKAASTADKGHGCGHSHGPACNHDMIHSH